MAKLVTFPKTPEQRLVAAVGPKEAKRVIALVRRMDGPTLEAAFALAEFINNYAPVPKRRRK